VSTVSRSTLVLVLISLAACGCGGTHDRPDGTPPQGGTATSRPQATSTPSPPRAGSGAAWTEAKLVRRLAGRRIAVGEKEIRVDASTLTCGGTGRPAGRRGGEPTWRRFRCVQPTFPPGSVAGPDAIFFAQPRDRTRVDVSGGRLTTY
jgi:hypothetical protein